MKINLKMMIPLIIFLLIFPTVASLVFPNVNNYVVLLMFNIIMYSTMGTAWYIIGGLARQISWAHAAFFAVGAYSTMIAYQRFGLTPWLGIVAGMGIAALLALIIGFASFKLHGVFFSLSTIAFGQIFYRFLHLFGEYTGGASGLIMRKSTESSFINLQFAKNDSYYYLLLAVFVITYIICKLVENSRIGYCLKAIKENEIAAESLGIKPYEIKLKAFIISAVLTSIVGSIFAVRFKFIDPASVASHDLAIRIGMTVIVGGLASTEGPIIGAFIMVPLLELTNAFFGNVLNGGLSQTLYGVVLVLIVIFMPNGVLSLIKSKTKRLKYGKNTLS